MGLMFWDLQGYNGTIEDEIVQMNSHSVANIIQRGGTILKTARSKESYSEEGRKKADNPGQKRNRRTYLWLGGDGSLQVLINWARSLEFPTLVCPVQLIKDLYGTDFTIIWYHG